MHVMNFGRSVVYQVNAIYIGFEIQYNDASSLLESNLSWKLGANCFCRGERSCLQLLFRKQIQTYVGCTHLADQMWLSKFVVPLH